MLARLRIELGEIKLKWGPPLELQVDGVKFYHPKSLEKLLQSDNVLISTDLASLWKRRFSVPQVLIRDPEIVLKRTSDGSWNWRVPEEGVSSQRSVIPAAVATAAAGPGGSGTGQGLPPAVKNFAGGSLGLEFRLDKLEVRNGTVRFTDETVQPAFLVRVERVEVLVSQKADASFHYKATGKIADLVEKDLVTEGDVDPVSQVLDFVLRYGQDKVVFKGDLKVVNTVPRFDGSLEIRGLKIETVTPEVYKRGEHLAGTLDAKMQLSFENANPESMKRSLRGQGKLVIRDGALKNRNVVKEVFDRISPVIAITNALGGELPPEVSEMLEGPDTPFQSLELSCTVASGVVRTEELAVSHPNYQLSGSGSFNIMEHRIDSTMQLTLSQTISAYLIKKIRELQFVSDRNGLVAIPFRYAGRFPNASVQPDLQYVTTKVLQSGAEEMIDRGLKKLSKFLEKKT